MEIPKELESWIMASFRTNYVIYSITLDNLEARSTRLQRCFEALFQIIPEFKRHYNLYLISYLLDLKDCRLISPTRKCLYITFSKFERSDSNLINYIGTFMSEMTSILGLSARDAHLDCFDANKQLLIIHLFLSQEIFNQFLEFEKSK